MLPANYIASAHSFHAQQQLPFLLTGPNTSFFFFFFFFFPTSS
jgi:hypothetical protein